MVSSFHRLPIELLIHYIRFYAFICVFLNAFLYFNKFAFFPFSLSIHSGSPTFTVYPLSAPGCHGGANQRKLYNDLMVNYNRLERPVQNDSAPIVVELGLTLLQIIDVVSVHVLLCICLRVCVLSYQKSYGNQYREMHYLSSCGYSIGFMFKQTCMTNSSPLLLFV